MAQALLEDKARKLGLDIDVKSAGIFALDGQNATKETVRALKAEDIDLSNHRANIIHRHLLEEADLILTMAISHKDALISKYDFVKGKTYTLKEYAYGVEEDIADPFGGDINIYNATKEEIKNAIEEIVNYKL